MLARISIAEAAKHAAEAPDTARLELVGPFVDAAARVLGQECGEAPQRGTLHRVRSPQTNNELSALIAITGGVAGLVIYSMTEDVALNVASTMIGEPLAELDALGQSAIAELANMITGQAGIALERNGFPSDMSPPVLLLGKGSSIATLNLTRLVIPLMLSFGEFRIDIAIKEV
jgi:chemotaxis protein CheX